MTRQKSFKCLVRTRMEKTGESYTAGRASLLSAEEPKATEGPALTIVRRGQSGVGPGEAGRSGSSSSTSGARPSGPIRRSRAGLAASKGSMAGTSSR
jgi:hypothetical protein